MGFVQCSKPWPGLQRLVTSVKLVLWQVGEADASQPVIMQPPVHVEDEINEIHYVRTAGSLL